MKYNVAAYLLGYIGEIEAADKAEAETRIKQMCNYPLSAPIIIQYIEEAEVPNEDKQTE